jgi:hypothetical protein
MAAIKIDRGGYKPRVCTPAERKRLRKGIAIVREGLERDEMERRKRYKLPNDWGSRIIRHNGKVAKHYGLAAGRFATM